MGRWVAALASCQPLLLVLATVQLLPLDVWLLLLCGVGGIEVSMSRVISLACTLPPVGVTTLDLLLVLVLGLQQRLGSDLK